MILYTVEFRYLDFRGDEGVAHTILLADDPDDAAACVFRRVGRTPFLARKVLTVLSCRERLITVENAAKSLGIFNTGR